MLLRRHKINSTREGTPNNVPEDIQQEELYGEELKYKPKDAENEQSGGEDKPLTKTDINRMNKAELLEMAKEYEVEGADDMTGAELKEYLLNMLGL